MKNASVAPVDDETAALRVFHRERLDGIDQQDVPKGVGNDGRLGAARRAPVNNGYETTSVGRGAEPRFVVPSKAGIPVVS